MAHLKLNAAMWLDFIDTRIKKIQTNRKTAVVSLGKVAKVAMRERLKGGEYSTGKLRRSIGNPSAGGIYNLIVTNDMVKLEIGSELKHAIIVDKGIPHEWMIPPSPMPKGKYMVFHWKKKGKKVFAKQVKHPVYEGKFYLEYGYNAVYRELQNIAMRFFE